MHMHTHTHTHIHAHAHAHTQMHTHTHFVSVPFPSSCIAARMWEAHKQRSDEAEDCSISPFCVHKKFPIGMFGQVRKDGKKSVVEKMKKRCGRNEMVKKNEVYNICPSRAEGGIAIFF